MSMQLGKELREVKGTSYHKLISVMLNGNSRPYMVTPVFSKLSEEKTMYAIRPSSMFRYSRGPSYACGSC